MGEFQRDNKQNKKELTCTMTVRDTAVPSRCLFPSVRVTLCSGVTGAAGTAAGFAFGLLRLRRTEIEGRQHDSTPASAGG